MHYCSLLCDASIPALLGAPAVPDALGRSVIAAVPILVPGPYHERASEIIASCEAALSDGRREEDDFFDDDDDEEEEEEDDDFFSNEPEDDFDDDEDDDLDDDLDDL